MANPHRPVAEDKPSRRHPFNLTFTYGSPVLGLCGVYAHETERSGVNLDMQCSEAVLALVRGEPQHRGAPAARAALAALPPFGPFRERFELYTNLFDMTAI